MTTRVSQSGEYGRSPSRDGSTRDYEPPEESVPLTSWDATYEEDGDVYQKPYSEAEERRVVRQLDKHLVLFVALLYLLSFLDRSNIGNAKAAGMEADLGITGSQFQRLLDAFYITYILFEFATIGYRLFPAHIYISICVLAMGTIAALQSISTGYISMLILRLCLGIAEASFGPGIPFYLSFFFKRDELATRTGLFIAAAPLANTFAGSLAWLILQFAELTSIDGWRLLFIVEGCPNVILAVLAWYVIPDSPNTVAWLSPRERKIAVLRLQSIKDPASLSTGYGQDQHRRRGLSWRKIAAVLKDPKSYIMAGILFSLNIAFSSLPVFLPEIIKNMGFDSISAQGMSALPNLVAFSVVLATARLSDRYHTRSTPLILHALLAMFGYSLLAFGTHMPHLLRYLCLFPITSGFFSAVTMIIVWTINNQESDEGKAVGSSILQVFGHIGSLVGQQLYPDGDAPFYIRGHATCACFMTIAAALTAVLRIVLRRQNSKRLREKGFEMQEHDREAVARTDVFEYIL